MLIRRRTCRRGWSLWGGKQWVQMVAQQSKQKMFFSFFLVLWWTIHGVKNFSPRRISSHLGIETTPTFKYKTKRKTQHSSIKANNHINMCVWSKGNNYSRMDIKNCSPFFFFFGLFVEWWSRGGTPKKSCKGVGVGLSGIMKTN